MRKLVVVAIVLVAAVGQGSPAAAQLSAPPPTTPTGTNLPWWFVKHKYLPGGTPWFYRNPPWPQPRNCRVAYWYPAQFWNTDEWGHTVTWTGYAPQYVCD
jgi:hypothetical protein